MEKQTGNDKPSFVAYLMKWIIPYTILGITAYILFTGKIGYIVDIVANAISGF